MGWGVGGIYYEDTRPANHLRDFEFSLVLGKLFRSDTIIYFKAAGGKRGNQKIFSETTSLPH